MSKVYLVTGANSGLGLDTVRQLALRSDTKKVYLACRTPSKATSAIEQLVQEHGIRKDKLVFVKFDASASKKEIHRIVDEIELPIDGLILNAGGIGHDSTGKPTQPNGVLDIHQINVIGHIQLVEILKEANLLAEGGRIVFSGSEAARGIPIMMIANPKLGVDASWYHDHLVGKSKGKYDAMKEYSSTKAMAALYFTAWARRNPNHHVLVVSPGGTSGTEALSAKGVPAHFRVMMPVMMPVMNCLGVFHPLEAGAQRYVEAVLGQNSMETMASGTFVASKRGTTGKVVDQTKLNSGKKYADHGKQEAAFEALSAFA